MAVRYVVPVIIAALLAIVGGSAIADNKKSKEQPKQSTKAPASKDGYMKASPSK